MDICEAFMAIKMCIQENPIKAKVAFSALLPVLMCMCGKRRRENKVSRMGVWLRVNLKLYYWPILQPKLQILEQLFLPGDVTSTPRLRQIIL